MKNKEHTPFKVISESYSYETSEVDPDDRWSRASTSTSHTINDILVGTEKNFNCTGNFIIENNQEKVFLVSAVYSTGDSFGNDEGYGLILIEVFKTLKKAERCVKQIENNAKLYNLTNGFTQRYGNNKEKEKKLNELIPYINQFYPKIKIIDSEEANKTINDINKTLDSSIYSAPYQDEQDEIRQTHASWNGYFESLDSVSINSFTLSPKNKIKKYKL